MTVEELQLICNDLKGVTQDIKWDDHLCFNVGEKMFLITSPDHFPVTASFKADDEDFEALCSKESFIPAPYLARYKWVQVEDITRLSLQEWTSYIGKSYELIFQKLPTRIRKQILES